MGRQHGTDRPPGQLAVTHFPPPGGAHPAGLADAEGGEVVVQQEALVVLAFEDVHHLLVVAGTQGGDHQGLGFAAGEQGRAVGPGQDADLRDDGADLVDRPAIDADARLDDVAADDLALELLQHAGQLLAVSASRVGVGLGQGGRGLGLGLADGVLALTLGDDLVGRRHVCAHQLPGLGLQGLGVVGGELEGLLGGMLGQFDDRVDHRLHGLVGEGHAAQDHLFGELLDLGLHHHDRVAGSSDDQVHGRFLHLVEGRVEDVLAVDVAHAGGADRPHEGCP